MDRFPQRRAVELLGVLARSPSHSAMVPTSWPPTAQMKLEAFEPIVQTQNLQRDSFIDVLKLNSPSVYCGVGYAMLYVMGVSRVLEKKFVNEMTIERQGHGRGRGVWIPVWCGPTELESDGSPSGLPFWNPHYLAAYNQDKYSQWAMSVEFFSHVQDRLCHCCFGVVASLRSPTLGGNVVVSCPLPCQGMVGCGNLAYHAMVAIESVLKQASVQRERPPKERRRHWILTSHILLKCQFRFRLALVQRERSTDITQVQKAQTVPTANDGKTRVKP